MSQSEDSSHRCCQGGRKVVAEWDPVLRECSGDPPGKYKCEQTSKEKRETGRKRKEHKMIAKENVKK